MSFRLLGSGSAWDSPAPPGGPVACGSQGIGFTALGSVCPCKVRTGSTSPQGCGEGSTVDACGVPGAMPGAHMPVICPCSITSWPKAQPSHDPADDNGGGRASQRTRLVGRMVSPRRSQGGLSISNSPTCMWALCPREGGRPEPWAGANPCSRSPLRVPSSQAESWGWVLGEQAGGADRRDSREWGAEAFIPFAAPGRV